MKTILNNTFVWDEELFLKDNLDFSDCYKSNIHDTDELSAPISQIRNI